MNNLHIKYAKYYNKFSNRIGHVFGERFNNKIVQPNNYGLWLSRYIHRQPVEGGIVKNPEDYPWTSYRAYIGLTPVGFLKPDVILEQFGSGVDTIKRYKEFVEGKNEGPIDWSNVKSGQILGDERFVKKFAKRETGKNNGIQPIKHLKSPEEIYIEISNRLGISKEVLFNPIGKEEKILRHKAFKILKEEYDFSTRHIASIFKVSPMTVVKGLKKFQR